MGDVADNMLERETEKTFTITARGINLLAGIVAKETARAVSEAMAPTSALLAGLLEASKLKQELPIVPAGLTVAEISDRLTRATKMSPVEASSIAYALVEDTATDEPADEVDEAESWERDDVDDPDLLETAFLVALHSVAGMISCAETAVEKAGRIARLAVKELRQ